MSEFFQSNSVIFANIFGFAAMLTAVIMYQFRKHRTIMLLMMLCSSLWCLHYISLGLYTPAAMNLLNVIRNTVYSFRNRKWAQNKFIPVIFIFISVVSTVITWKNPWSILPFIASVFSVTGQWQTDTKILKGLSYPVCICWFVYNTVSRSFPGMANEAFVFISLTAAFIRDRKHGKPEASHK